MVLKVAVIGAGLAGLCTARQLKEEQVDVEVVVFEKTNQIGGTWVYSSRVDSDPLGQDPNRKAVHSSIYQNLRVHLPRQMMGLMDYPFTQRENGDPRAFPGHEEVLHFIKDFARDYGLVDLIRLEHEVVRVEPLSHGHHKWAVEWRRSGGAGESDVFDAVVICNGRYAEPTIAEFPGMNIWPGLQIHSHNYRFPSPFKDQIVLIIGNGTSGFEIARDVASVAKQVHQSTRTPSVIYDNVTDNGFTISKHSMIKCGHEDGKLDFEDGTSIYADVIIHCTGYKINIPFLRTNGIVEIEDNRVGPLYQHVFPPTLAPWLSLVGLPSMGGVTVIELQSKWVAKVLTGKLELPTVEEMMSSVLQFYQQLEDAGCPKSHTHKLQNVFEHENWLVGEMGLPPLEKWRQLLFTTLFSVFKSHGAAFRDAIDIDNWMLQQQQEQQDDATATRAQK